MVHNPLADAQDPVPPPLPKSVTRSRVEENSRIFDFKLTEDEMAAITELNLDQRIGADPDTFDWIP